MSEECTAAYRELTSARIQLKQAIPSLNQEAREAVERLICAHIEYSRFLVSPEEAHG